MWKRVAGAFAALLLTAGCLMSRDEALDEWQAGDFYFVTVGVSKLVIMMPKNGLLADPSTNESMRYFHFSTSDESLIVSGWFEPGRSGPARGGRVFPSRATCSSPGWASGT